MTPADHLHHSTTQASIIFAKALAELNATDTQFFPRDKKLRVAVQAAIDAYATTGHMLNAAMAYAAHGFPVFPVTVTKKKPVPARDIGANGNPIPGTGGFKKATTDQSQIRKWWMGHEYLIGLPMGAASGVWALDVDTSEDHADGVAEWNAIAAEHEPIVTREHRSATGGPHIIFNWYAGEPLRCSSGDLPKGIEVKAQGGYVVVPPSKRKHRSYTVHVDSDPTDAPQWLTGLILQGRKPSRAAGADVYTGQVTADLDELADAMSFIPNDDVDWEEWTAMGLRLFAASNGQGFDLFDRWSSRSCKYDSEETLQRWEEIQGSPPNRTGAGKIFKMAREHGWVQGLREIAPTYSDEGAVTADAARVKVRVIVRDFLRMIADVKDNFFVAYWFFIKALKELDPIAWALPITTGTGKTRITIEELAAWLRTFAPGAVIYAVPRHKRDRDAIRDVWDQRESVSRPRCRRPRTLRFAKARR